MTLNQAARLLSAAMTVGGMLAFMTTGSLAMGMLVLAAPLPIKWVSLSDRRTWSVGEVLRGKRDDHTVSDALDQAIRGPLPIRRVTDDAFFVPDCPRLGAEVDEVTRGPAPSSGPRPTTPLASTPLR